MRSLKTNNDQAQEILQWTVLHGFFKKFILANKDLNENFWIYLEILGGFTSLLQLSTLQREDARLRLEVPINCLESGPVTQRKMQLKKQQTFDRLSVCVVLNSVLIYGLKPLLWSHKVKLQINHHHQLDQFVSQIHLLSFIIIQCSRDYFVCSHILIESFNVQDYLVYHLVLNKFTQMLLI